MRALWQLFRRSDRRVVITVLFFFACVCFAVYQVATSLGTHETAPAYRNQPPTGVSPIPVQSLIGNQHLTTPRLPDDIWRQLAGKCLVLAQTTANFQLTPAALIADGVSQSYATTLYNSVHSQEPGYAGRAVLEVGPGVQLTNTDPTDAIFQVTAQYGTAPGNVSSGPENATISCGFHLLNSRWILASLSLE
jgi:hypothetical protein